MTLSLTTKEDMLFSGIDYLSLPSIRWLKWPKYRSLGGYKHSCCIVFFLYPPCFPLMLLTCWYSYRVRIMKTWADSRCLWSIIFWKDTDTKFFPFIFICRNKELLRQSAQPAGPGLKVNHLPRPPHCTNLWGSDVQGPVVSQSQPHPPEHPLQEHIRLAPHYY